MIDIENDIIELVTQTVLTAYPNADVSGQFTEFPAKFPAVTVVEADNYVNRRMRTFDRVENADSVMYEINVYSAKSGTKKSEAKDIMNLIDNALLAKNFTRTMKSQIPNAADKNIYRIVARYTADVKETGREEYAIHQS